MLKDSPLSYQLDDFDYHLPTSLIAKYPLAERSASRLLVVNPAQTSITNRQFQDVLTFLSEDDLLVFNNTKVIPARLEGKKATGGRLELLVERIISDKTMLAHIKASHAPKVGSLIYCGSVAFTVLERQNSLFLLKSESEEKIIDIVQEQGAMPLPPYMERSAQALDESRYQTVYAKIDGAVAAPTAGLHFDEVMLEKIKAKGVATAEVTLHVGAGTFQPVRVDDLDEHHMHSEWLDVSQEVCDAVLACQQRGGRVVAVGTTVVRSLEAAFAAKGDLLPFSGETNLFIRPGFKFQCVDVLITNFHLPKSTLLMLVSAFGGYDLMREAYQKAVENKYRFFSYGDAMLIHRKNN